MVVKTVNPYTGEELHDYREEREEEIAKSVHNIRSEQREWGKDIDRRVAFLREVLKPGLVRMEKELAQQMTLEMGKPISQSLAEIRKCALLVDYFAENAVKLLTPEQVNTGAKKSYVRFDPIGVVELIMPWNYPMWQVMRAAVPALAAGNGVILKHASIVSGTSMMIERLMQTSLFKSVIARGDDVLACIRYVDGVSFTGSTTAGAAIAERAGRELKKTVLELGGSDPFIVLPSADIKKAAKNAAYGRLQNAGQSCIASKRFIVHESVYDEFYSELRANFESTVSGDPMDEKTFLGPLSSSQQSNTVLNQIHLLKSMGTVDSTGVAKGNFIPPTIVRLNGNYNDEIFGPVAVLLKYGDELEAIRIANETPFGLGSSIWGEPEEAERLAASIDAGMVFVNKIVASDPRVPFGGVKKSGYGRELSRYGLLEFTNIKTVWIED